MNNQPEQIEPPGMEPTEPVEIEQQEEQEEQVILSLIQQLEAFHAMDNIAEGLEQANIDTIAAKVVEDYNTDKDSRVEWERSNKEIMELARLNIKQKTYAGEPVASVKYPIITNAAIQFAARAYPEIIKGTEVVKSKIVGKDPGGLKAARGDRVAEHMSYQLLNQMSDWEDGVDQLLFTLPVVGCAFKKTYRSGVENQNVSEMVLPDNLVVHSHAVSLEKASRITHVIELTRNEIVERIRSGVFLYFDVDELGLPPNEDRDDTDEDTPHKFLEQHRWYDLDEDGYQEPYIVTVHDATEKLVRISARFELSGISRNKKDEIIRIEPTHYFTRFLFMPSPDGNFYGMGFGSLLHSINSASNTVINQLLDAGTSSNRQSGFIGKGVQLGKGKSLRLKSGEWRHINVTGDDLRKNLFPLPTKEPSNVLFSLLGLMVDVGKELSGITEVLSGQSPGANVPAETTLALIEQGLQVYSAIHKRVHRSLYREFQKIRKLNVLYLDPEEYYNVVDSPDANKDADYNASDHDIIPVSDPNSTTNMQRIMKAKALLSMKGQGLNDQEINKRYLEALQIEDIEGLIPEEQAPDPAMELELQAKQAEIQTSVAEQGKIAAETELTVEKIQTEKVLQEVKRLGTKFDQQKLTLEKAQTISDIKATEKRNNIDAAKLINDIKITGQKPPAKPKDSKFEGKTAKTNTQGAYREKGMVSNNAIPGRASGGPVEKGQPYMVGEEGPEIVIPDRNSQVIPNDELSTQPWGQTPAQQLDTNPNNETISSWEPPGVIDKIKQAATGVFGGGSVMDPTLKETGTKYAKTANQLMDFTINEFGPDVANELMANSGGNVEFFGRMIRNKTIQEAGQTAEDYWRKRQTDTWNNMSGKQKALAGYTIDPLNAVVGGAGKLMKPVGGFVKAGTKLLSKKAIAALIAFEKAADAEDVYSDLKEDNNKDIS